MSDESIRAVAVHEDEDRPRVIRIPKPEPAPGEVLVKILRVGIDGTDHHVIEGRHGEFPEDASTFVLGHEAVGVVADANGTEFAAGDVVVPTVRRPVGASNEYAERNELDMAPADAYVECGISGAQGFMAEYVTAPAEYLVPVPRSIAEYAFLVEPISNAEKAIDHAFASRSAFEWTPECATVLGNGPLGLLTLAVLERRFQRTYCVGRRDRPDPTIDVIERLGATYVDSRETAVSDLADEYEPMDLVYEATGYAKHAFETVDALAPNGVGALLGIPEAWTFDVDGGRLHRDLVMENKALIGSVNSSVPHFEAAIESLDSFPEWLPEALITGVYSPTSVEEAFDGDRGDVKVVVEFDCL